MTSDGERLQAVLFDMDGLLIDSEPLWSQAESELAHSLGVAWTAEAKAACIGRRLDDAVPAMLAALGVPVTADREAGTAAFLLARMIELFSSQALPLMPGARELLDALAAVGVPCALVSSSFRVLVDACLAGLPGHPFAVTVAGDEVALAKPHPAPYLRAAAGLGADPARCVVLEDSTAGAAAGVAAGCRTMLIPSLPGPDALHPEVAGAPDDQGWLVRRSLWELDVASLRALVPRPG